MSTCVKSLSITNIEFSYVDKSGDTCTGKYKRDTGAGHYSPFGLAIFRLGGRMRIGSSWIGQVCFTLYFNQFEFLILVPF